MLSVWQQSVTERRWVLPSFFMTAHWEPYLFYNGTSLALLELCLRLPGQFNRTASYQLVPCRHLRVCPRSILCYSHIINEPPNLFA